MPTIPPWEGMHPVVVHAPIALLCLVPLMILLGVLLVPSRRGLEIATFVLLLVGSIGGFLALQSGEAAEHYAEEQSHNHAEPEVGEAMHEVIEEHESWGKIASFGAIGLTLAYFVVFVVPGVRNKLKKTRPYAVAIGVFMLLSLCSVYSIAMAGHYGGQLSHVYNVKSPYTQEMKDAPTESTITPIHNHDEDDDDDADGPYGDEDE